MESKTKKGKEKKRNKTNQHKEEMPFPLFSSSPRSGLNLSHVSHFPSLPLRIRLCEYKVKKKRQRERSRE